MKSSGKTTTGRVLAGLMQAAFVDVDKEIEQQHTNQHQEKLSFREIFRTYGGEYFRTLEHATLQQLVERLSDKRAVLSTGGGTPLAEHNQPLLRSLGTVVFLDADASALLSRITAGGIPAFFPYPDDPQRSLTELLAVRRPVYAQVADLTITFGSEPAEIVARILFRSLEH
jgi:shikimate kinase